MRVSAITMHCGTDRSANLAKAHKMVAEAAGKGAQLVLLPEMFSIYGLKSYKDYGETGELGASSRELSPSLAALAELAQSLKVSIAGTVPERLDADVEDANDPRVFNTLYVLSPEGKVSGKYRKTHLFNLIDPDGTPRYKESDTFVPGDALSTMALPSVSADAGAKDEGAFRTALSTCYDIRFSKLYHQLSQNQPLDIILAPSAFTAATGKAHWHTLLQSRAIEFQSYVIAANQTGSHGKGKASYGHSVIIDPWGEVLADTGEGEGIALADISHARLAEVRAALPVFANQRRDIYPDEPTGQPV